MNALKRLPKLSAKSHEILDYVVEAGLFTVPKVFAFQGKHILLLHAVGCLLTCCGSGKKEFGTRVKSSPVKSIAEGVAGAGFLWLAFSKLKMQKRARLTYGLGGLALAALAVCSEYSSDHSNQRKNKSGAEDGARDIEDSTWTEAAVKAQDDLDKNESVSEEHAGKMGEHSAA